MNLDFLSLLITQTWQVTLLILIVWATTRLVAKNRPHLAHMLWVLVLIKCLTPPIWSSPTSAFSWMVADRISPTTNSIVIQPQQRPAIEDLSLLDPIVVRAVPQTDRPETVLKNPLFSPTEETASLSTLPVATTDGSKTFSWIWIGIWIAGASLGILITTIRFLLFLCWIRKSESIDLPEFDASTQRLAKRLGVLRKIHVKTLDAPVGPAVLGLFRPTILLPVSIVRGKTWEQLEPLMAHELIHIRRGDLWWAMIQTIAKSVFWFHPLVCFAAKMVTRESERSCDEETVACLGCHPSTYANGLLEVLEHKHRLRVAPALPGVRPVDITSARLERVMNLGNGIHRRTPVWVWLVLVVSCVVVLPGAAMVFGQNPGTPNPQVPAQQGSRLPTVSDSAKVPFLADLPIIGGLFDSPTKATSLPSDESTKSGNGKTDWQVIIYDVGDVMEDLREWHTTLSASTLNVNASPLALFGCRSRGKNGESSTPNGRQAQIATANGVISLGGQDPTMQLVGNCLYAFGTNKDHAKIDRLHTQFRQYGFRQVVVETMILKMPTHQLVDLGIDWLIAPVATNGIIDDSLIKQTSYDPNGIKDYSEFLIGTDAWSGSFDASELNESATRQTIAAASFVEKNSPVLFAMLDQKEVQTIISRAKGDSESNLYQAPTLAMFNGQDASIVSGSQRPFVVGLNRVQDKTSDAFADQPVIRIINEGVVLNLNAQIIDGEGVNLDCRLECSTVLSVDTIELPIKDAQQEPAKIQVPEVATTRIQSSLDVAAGKTLVLSCVQRKEDGETELFMAFLTCFLPDSENPDARRQAKTTRPPAQTEPQEVVVDEDGELHLVSVTPGSDKPVPSTKLIIRSEEPGNDNIDYQPLVEAMNSFDVATNVEGNVQFDINHSLPTIRGKNLSISFDGLCMTGDQGEMKVLSKDHFVFQFAGDVRLNTGESTIQADELTFDPTIGYQMKGSVSVINDEGDDTKRVCSADKIRIDFEKRTLTLLGNARYTWDGDHRADIQAEFIEVNVESDEIKSSTTNPTSDDKDLFRS